MWIKGFKDVYNALIVKKTNQCIRGQLGFFFLDNRQNYSVLDWIKSTYFLNLIFLTFN